MTTYPHRISLAEFETLEGAWDELALSRRLPTLSHGWTRAALKALHPGDTPYLFAIRSTSGELIAGACLVQERNSPYLRWLGNYAVPEPCYLIARDLDAERRALRAIRAVRLPLHLDRVPLELLSDTDLRGALGPTALRHIRTEGGSPWLPLGGSWREFEESLSAQRRSDLRRAHRKASALGQLSFELLEKNDAPPAQLLERYFALERRSWKYHAGTAIELDTKATRFFRALIDTPIPLWFGFVSIGKETVAAQIMVDYADTVWVLKTAFHNDYRSCSPGVLLMHEAIKFGLERGRRAFEFLGFEEPWLKVWARGVREYRTVRVYTYSPRGASALGHELWETLKRRFRPHLPLTAES